MSKTRLNDNHILAGTFALVLLLGVPTFYSLTDSSAVQDHALASAHASRNPASVPSVKDFMAERASLSAFANIDLNCTKKNVQPVKLQGEYVQLQGKNCVSKVMNVEIVNKSNGYTASIFNSGRDQYQTDLIQLKSGENEIAIRYVDVSGKSVEQIVHIHSTQI